MKSLRILPGILLLVAITLCAQVVADGATNTLSNVTHSITGRVAVGPNGLSTVLVLSNDCTARNDSAETRRTRS